MRYFSLFLLLISSTASAGLITSESIDFNYRNFINSYNPDSQTDSTVENYNISGFDSSLGELIGVTISMDSTLSVYKEVSGYSSNNCTFGGCLVEASGKGEHLSRFGLFSSSAGYFYLNPVKKNVNISCSRDSTRGSCSEDAFDSYDFNFSFNALGLTDIDYFLQDTFLVTWVNALSYESCTSNNRRSVSCSYNANVRWQGNLLVSYEYNATQNSKVASVSEPFAWTLLPMGLLIMLRVRARKA